MPRMFPDWDFVVGTLPQKAMLNMGWIFAIFNCQYIFSNKIDNKGQMPFMNSIKRQKTQEKTY